jgi:NAD-dependent deacetylase
MTSEDKLAQFSNLIDQSSNIVFFTGAGISTESGIPDFRSPGTGIWNKISPIEFQDFVRSEEVRKESWKRKFNGNTNLSAAEPNVGHKAISLLIQHAKARSVITQNIDNLHQKSDVPDDKVIELHGNAGYAKCLSCDARYELNDLEAQFEEFGQVNPCVKCGGIIKTATISFGQAMPSDAMDRAQRETIASDLFVVVGSSLVVYPAAGFPELATQMGIPLVIVNREATPLDPIASIVLHEEIGPTLGFVVGINETPPN